MRKILIILFFLGGFLQAQTYNYNDFGTIYEVWRIGGLSGIQLRAIKDFPDSMSTDSTYLSVERGDSTQSRLLAKELYVNYGDTTKLQFVVPLKDTLSRILDSISYATTWYVTYDPLDSTFNLQDSAIVISESVDNADSLGQQPASAYMLKSVYDVTGNNVVDNTEALGGQIPAYYLDWTDTTSHIASKTWVGNEGFLTEVDSTHTHDSRYYTETELNAGQLDSRYYTESEIDAFNYLSSVDLTSDVTGVLPMNNGGTNNILSNFNNGNLIKFSSANNRFEDSGIDVADLLTGAEEDPVFVAARDSLAYLSQNEDITGWWDFQNHIEQTGAYHIRNADYLDGIFGNGWQISYNNFISELEIDNIRVRHALRTHEFRYDVVKATNGRLYISDAGVISRWVDSTTDSLYFDNQQSAVFEHLDTLWIKEVDASSGSASSIKVEVDTTGGASPVTLTNDTRYKVNLLLGSFAELDTGMTAVRISGNALYMTAESGSEHYFQVQQGQTSSKVKARLGNLTGITFNGTPLSGYGLYTNNGYFEGKVVANGGTIADFDILGGRIRSTDIIIKSGASAEILLGDTTYSNAGIGLKNDGSGKLASGNISWDASGQVTLKSNLTSEGLSNWTSIDSVGVKFTDELGDVSIYRDGLGGGLKTSTTFDANYLLANGNVGSSGQPLTSDGANGARFGNMSGNYITSGTIADARIASTIARDSELIQITQDALSVFPSSPSLGDVYVDQTSSTAYMYLDGGWRTIASW